MKNIYSQKYQQDMLLERQKKLEAEAASGQTFTASELAKRNAKWSMLVPPLIMGGFLIIAGIILSSTGRWWLTLEAGISALLFTYLAWRGRSRTVDSKRLAAMAEQARKQRMATPLILALGIWGAFAGIALNTFNVNIPSVLLVLFGSLFTGIVFAEATLKLAK